MTVGNLAKNRWTFLADMLKMGMKWNFMEIDIDEMIESYYDIAIT